MIITTCFAAKLLKSLYPKQIPVTASVWAYLHNCKKYTLPTNIPLCEINMDTTGATLGAALHFWARMELVKFVSSQRGDNKAIALFYNTHKLSFEDYDYESAVKNCQRNVKKSEKSSHFFTVPVQNFVPPQSTLPVPVLLGKANGVQKYCKANGIKVTHNCAVVWLLKINTNLTHKKIAAQLMITARCVTKHLCALRSLPFAIPSHVLSPPLETS
jgi:hypothetical protein